MSSLHVYKFEKTEIGIYCTFSALYASYCIASFKAMGLQDDFGLLFLSFFYAFKFI